MPLTWSKMFTAFRAISVLACNASSRMKPFLSCFTNCFLSFLGLNYPFSTSRMHWHRSMPLTSNKMFTALCAIFCTRMQQNIFLFLSYNKISHFTLSLYILIHIVSKSNRKAMNRNWSNHSRTEKDKQQGGTIFSHWNSYILSIKLRTKSNIDIVQNIFDFPR